MLKRRRILFYLDINCNESERNDVHFIMKSMLNSSKDISCALPMEYNELIDEENKIGIKHFWRNITNFHFDINSLDTKEPERFIKWTQPELIVFVDRSILSNIAAKQIAINKYIPYFILNYNISVFNLNQVNKILYLILKHLEKSSFTITKNITLNEIIEKYYNLKKYNNIHILNLNENSNDKVILLLNQNIDKIEYANELPASLKLLTYPGCNISVKSSEVEKTSNHLRKIFSLVIGSYNPNVVWLNEALKSAENLFDEIILVDDGSKTPINIDGVKLFRKNNGGFYTARNFGIAKAQGDIIVSLDDDDILIPDNVKLLKEIVQNTNYDIYTFPIEIFGNSLGYWAIEPELRNLLISNQIPSGSWFTKSVWKKIGGFQYPVAEDWDFWCRCTKIGATFVHFDMPIYKHRERNDSIWATKSKSDLEVRLDIQDRYKYFDTTINYSQSAESCKKNALALFSEKIKFTDLSSFKVTYQTAQFLHLDKLTNILWCKNSRYKSIRDIEESTGLDISAVVVFDERELLIDPQIFNLKFDKDIPLIYITHDFWYHPISVANKLKTIKNVIMILRHESAKLLFDKLLPNVPKYLQRPGVELSIFKPHEDKVYDILIGGSETPDYPIRQRLNKIVRENAYRMNWKILDMTGTSLLSNPPGSQFEFSKALSMAKISPTGSHRGGTQGCKLITHYIDLSLSRKNINDQYYGLSNPEIHIEDINTAGITPRYLESFASKTLLLADLPDNDLQSWYKDKMIVLNHSDSDAQLIQLIDHYIHNDYDREIITERAYKAVLDTESSEKKALDLLNIIEKHLKH